MYAMFNYCMILITILKLNVKHYIICDLSPNKLRWDNLCLLLLTSTKQIRTYVHFVEQILH